jgi:uncharacterized DUF497 family protein
MKKFVWDEWNEAHIAKHKVTKQEVEETSKSKTITSISYLGRKLIFGKTKKGRLLTIVISYAKQKEAYVVSARDMSKKERRIYYEKTKTNKTI